MKNVLLKYAIVLVIGAVAVATSVNAHSESTGNAAADHRIAEMKKLGKNMGAIAKVVKGEMEYNKNLTTNAKEIAEIAANLSKLFPEGSGVEASRAKPEIWEEKHKAEFQKDIEALQSAALQLVVAVESGDKAMIGPALKKAGGTCGGCHKMFRKPKKK